MSVCPIRFAASRAAVSTRASTCPGTPHAMAASVMNRLTSPVIASAITVLNRAVSSGRIWSPLFRPLPRAARQSVPDVIAAVEFSVDLGQPATHGLELRPPAGPFGELGHQQRRYLPGHHPTGLPAHQRVTRPMARITLPGTPTRRLAAPSPLLMQRGRREVRQPSQAVGQPTPLAVQLGVGPLLEHNYHHAP